MTHIPAWKKAYQNQTVKFKDEEISIYVIRGIILNTLQKLTKNRQRHMFEEVYCDCLSEIPRIAYDFRFSTMSEGQTYSVQGYIKRIMIRLIQKRLIINNVMQETCRDGGKTIRKNGKKVRREKGDGLARKFKTVFFSEIEAAKVNYEGDVGALDRINIPALQTSHTTTEEPVIKEDNERLVMKIIAIMDYCLDEREKDIILRRHYNNSNNWRENTLQQVGELHNISRERTRQIEKEGLNKLRAELEQRGLI